MIKYGCFVDSSAPSLLRKSEPKTAITSFSTSIWANYNNSLIWIKAIWGWFPLLTMISSELAVSSLQFTQFHILPSKIRERTQLPRHQLPPSCWMDAGGTSENIGCWKHVTTWLVVETWDDDILPNVYIWKNKKNVPSHQPVTRYHWVKEILHHLGWLKPYE